MNILIKKILDLKKEQWNFFQRIVDIFKKWVEGMKKQVDELPKKDIEDAIIEEAIKTPEPKYKWDTRENSRHSCRVIMDEYNLSWKEKDLLCDICQCESEFNPNAKLINNPQSIDRGLFQWNSFYHPDITDEMAYNPETATRLACKALKNKQIKILWSASIKCWNKDGVYNNYL